MRQRAIFDGAANVNNEKVFIAASLYDPEGALLGGEWAKSVGHIEAWGGMKSCLVSNDSQSVLSYLGKGSQNRPMSSKIVLVELVKT